MSSQRWRCFQFPHSTSSDLLYQPIVDFRSDGPGHLGARAAAETHRRAFSAAGDRRRKPNPASPGSIWHAVWSRMDYAPCVVHLGG